MGCAGLSLLIIIALVALLVFGELRRRRSAVAAPSCGRCGYLVRGLSTFTCPECGSDLREVGIVTPAATRPSAILKAVGWTALMAVSGVAIAAIAASLVPNVYEAKSQIGYAQPASGAYNQIVLVSHVKGSRRNPAHRRLMLKLDSNAPTPRADLEVDVPTGGYRYKKPAGQPVESASGFSAKVILDWMAANGLDVEDQRVRSEAAELFNQAQAAGNDPAGFVGLPAPGFGSRSSSSSSRSEPPSWLMVVLIVFAVGWFILWLAGLWRIMRRVQQPVNEAPAPETGGT